MKAAKTLPKGVVRKAKHEDVSKTESTVIDLDDPRVQAKLFKLEDIKVKDIMLGFAHLHFHTEFSILDGVGRVEDTVRACAAKGCRVLAVTDHGTTSAWFQFSKECKAYGVKPVFGVEVDVCDDNDVTQNLDYVPKHLVLLARNQQGYDNLLVLVSESWNCCYKEKPRVNYEMVGRYTDGLVCLTACTKGAVSYEILQGSGDEEKVLERLIGMFGKKNVFVELQCLETTETVRCNMRLTELAEIYGLKVIVTGDVHYVEKRYSKYRAALEAIRRKKTLVDLEKEEMFVGGARSKHCYLKGRKDFYKSFVQFNPNIPVLVVKRAIKDTIELGACLNAELKTYTDLMPTVKPPDGFKSNEEYLRHIVLAFDLTYYKGKSRELWTQKVKAAKDSKERKYWKRKLKNLDKEYMDRIEYELNLIIKKKYADYFVLIHQIYEFARR